MSYKYVRYSLILAIVASLTIFDTALASFSAGPYFPIQSGNFWTYQVDLGFSFTTTVLPGTTNVNGVPTKVLQDSDGGITNYLTNDSNGIRLHRQFDPDFGLTVTFSPPVKFANAVTDLGQTVNSSGTAATNFGNLSYTASYTIQAFENISVPAGEYTVLRVQGTISACSGSICEVATQTLYLAANIGVIKEIASSSAGAYTNELTATNVTSPQTVLAAALLPSSRSVQVGSIATVFATIVNGGTSTATSCGIAPITAIPATFSYQTTNPATNQVTGSPNTPANIVAGGFQSYLLSFVPTASFAPTDVQFSFSCTNNNPATIQTGLNTLLLSASVTPVPDIVALAATVTGDGIVNIPGTAGSGAFAVATVNVGAGGNITASADTGGAVLPVSLSLCQTNPATGLCISAIGPSVTTTINAGETPTLGIFVQGTGNVPFDPAANRVFVRFKDGGDVTRGSTSVAVRTQ